MPAKHPLSAIGKVHLNGRVITGTATAPDACCIFSKNIALMKTCWLL
jgi:hypothetical protein